MSSPGRHKTSRIRTLTGPIMDGGQQLQLPAAPNGDNQPGLRSSKFLDIMWILLPNSRDLFKP